MKDPIERQAAIDKLDPLFESLAIDKIKALPSAQPKYALTADDFETIRIHLSAYKEQLGNQHRWEEAEEYQRIIDRFMRFASAQPEIIHCRDCRYKDDGIDEDGIPFLKCLHGRSYGGTRINDFCSWAERRTDGRD